MDGTRRDVGPSFRRTGPSRQHPAGRGVEMGRRRRRCQGRSGDTTGPPRLWLVPTSGTMQGEAFPAQ